MQVVKWVSLCGVQAILLFWDNEIELNSQPRMFEWAFNWRSDGQQRIT